jgi:hypothetical protein
MRKYVKNLNNIELMERLAEDLVDMHHQTALDLGYWETALEVVERFYDVDVRVRILEKKESNA